MNRGKVEASCLGDTGVDGYIFVNVDLVGLMIDNMRLARSDYLGGARAVTGFDGTIRDLSHTQ